MNRRAVMATAHYLPTGRGSPVSIHGLKVWSAISDSLASRGIELVSLEKFRSGRGPKPTVVLWDFGAIAELPRDVASATDSIVAWSLESPLIAHRAYHRLPTIASRSSHVVGFPGVGELIDQTETRFVPVGWPNEPFDDPPTRDWETRELVAMINSNKRLHQWKEGFSWERPKQSLRLLASSLVARSYRLRRAWTVPNFYEKRMETILNLSGHPGFRLFGVGWDRALPGWGRSDHARILDAYGGEVGDKHTTLRRFRFAVCIENTAFPGYISEKIFDAMAAGAIPLYLGAPDVARYIPSDAYVDLRRFPDHGDLITFMEAVTRGEAAAFHDAARRFLNSPEFRLFTADHFASAITGAATVNL